MQIIWNSDPENWGDGGTGTRTYSVLRSGTLIVPALSYGTTSYNDTTGTNETNYVYRIRYNNGCGLSSSTLGVTATDHIDTEPCPDIGNVLLVSKSGTNAVITWSANACSDLANYRIFGSAYYSDPFPSAWDVLGNPVSNIFYDLLLSNYIAYKVLAVDDCGNISSN
ncbi:MAG: hypothetical protein A2Y62_09335 [Candidatus Fischerbacteria bacterium RBG_13_37_8]|uniref:Fibronectin type-III domain-containing protein n=1 Tax=Candidatus Fischerbacteria bacterium RBG_13_37_8 TaxID=1817863 RepID=A0A1F5VJZ4_9BACT|nr:MAG: hypothetical protein A2Y62_09335 [Candidatus Fischerbacteria bacterium RBG_13_37_8]